MLNTAATVRQYDVTHEAHPFEENEMCYFVSTILGKSYRHYISSHTLESDALKKAQQLQEKANDTQ